jgi:Lar family restriction alleviation protein
MSERPGNEPPWASTSRDHPSDVRLLDCPFCGSRRLGLYEYTYAKLFAVDCKKCGAQGPRHSSPGKAQALWNNRELDNEDCGATSSASARKSGDRK